MSCSISLLITIARFREKVKNINEFISILKGHREIDFGVFKVKELELLMSSLIRQHSSPHPTLSPLGRGDGSRDFVWRNQ